MKLTCEYCDNPLGLYTARYEVTRIVDDKMRPVGEAKVKERLIGRPMCVQCRMIAIEED
jgi:hypothetical protein